MRSHEQSFLTITSPSKKSIDIKKSKMSNFSKEERNLVWKCIDNEMIRNYKFEVELTTKEMKHLLNISGF
jgi:hypothetical protein